MKKVFVYGDFNILHPGHLRLLKFAKESGEHLVVGVYADHISSKSQTQAIRLESIRATSYVDESFILEGSPLEWIKCHRPDIVVKGKEHESRFNEEMSFLNSYGAKLLFSSGEIGFSSLDLLQKEFNTTPRSFVSHDHTYLNRHAITQQELINLIESFQELNVLVIGDTIVDEYITCNPLGMSQEDPTIVVSPISTHQFVGGAAIVASHARELGAKVTYLSVTGDDAHHTFVQHHLDSLGIDHVLPKDPTRPTTLKQRFRADNKTLLRVNHLKAHHISSQIEKTLLTHIDSLLETTHLIIFSDFSYGVITPSIIETLTKKALNNTIMMVADSQSSSQIGDISQFHAMSMVTPTEREIRLALNDFDSGLVVLSDKLYKKSHPNYILTTLGSEGVLIYNSDHNALLTDKIPALNSVVKDVSGAGDSLLTCSSLALCQSKQIYHSAYLGSIAAAIQVSRVGNIPIKKEEILQELHQGLTLA